MPPERVANEETTRLAPSPLFLPLTPLGCGRGEPVVVGSAPVQPQVSIVVPVFGTERYLGRCLSSLTSQTLAAIEIIVVDDGSPGDVAGVVAAAAAGDSRVRLLALPGNVGTMEARHIGALAARAPFLAFVDADDEVEPEYAEMLLATAVAHGADVVECAFTLVDDGAARIVRRSEAGVLDGSAVVDGFLRGRMNNAVWNKLFRSDLWRRATAPEVRRVEFAQDLLCVFLVALQCERYVRIDTSLYRYLPRDGSVTKAVSPERVAARLMALDSVYRTVRDRLAQRSEHIDPVRSLFDREFVAVTRELLDLSRDEAAIVPGVPPTPRLLGLMGSVAFSALVDAP